MLCETLTSQDTRASKHILLTFGLCTTWKIISVVADKAGELDSVVADAGDVMAKKKDKKKKKKNAAEKEKPTEVESPVEGDAISVENQRVSDYINLAVVWLLVES